MESRKKRSKEANATRRAWLTPEKSREYHLKYQYGLTTDPLKENKTGICSICHEVKKLVIDHRHDGTKNMRGLLCVGCNSAIGKLKEDPTILQRAIDYINRRNSNRIPSRRPVEVQLELPLIFN